MKELAKSNNPVFISWVRAVLSEADIECFIFDEHVSIVEGSIGILPRRIMVADEDHLQAQRLLADAEELREDD